MTHVAFRRHIRRLTCSALAAVAAAGALPGPGARAETVVSDVDRRLDAPGFREVGRVAVPVAAPDESPNDADKSGWLILNPASRRGYVVSEYGTQTTLRSFDLDTLQPRREFTFRATPIAAGRSAGVSGGQAGDAGEVIHAVDPVAGRIYLGLAINSVPLTGPDAKRMHSVIAVIDEVVFDRDPARAFGSFSLAPTQRHLAADHLVGMAMSRKGVVPGQPGKLLGLFASANQTATVSVGAVRTSFPVPFKHTLVQWSPGDLPTGSHPTTVEYPPLGTGVQAGGLPLQADWEATLLPCGTATLASEGGEGQNSNGQGNLQWGLLVTDEAVFTGCQSSGNSGAVVRIALDANGDPAVEPQQIAPYAKPIGDVLVDDVRKRLFLRSFGDDGTTWWLFDTASMRYVGSVAAAVGHTYSASGIDPATGRLYTLREDQCALRTGGGQVPVEGGLLMTDAAELPLGAPQLLVPELSRASVWRIVTDPGTRRVYVRRGHTLMSFQHRYPSCRDEDREIVEVERFYRVYENSIPLPPPRPAFDDSQFTTHVREEPDRTQASYLGTGAGYGARQLVVGGTDAPTRGAATTAKSLCGRDTREVFAGAVGKVELSDQSTVGEAAALDADEATQQVAADPVSRCRPQASPTAIAGRNTDELNDCHGDIDVREASFDQAKDLDENGDGCSDRDGRNRYAAACLDDDAGTSPGFDDGTNHAAPRDGFDAEVKCDKSNDKASGSATAAGSSDAADSAWRNANQGTGGIRVGHASSHVEVTRAANKGVTVKVDSIARGVEIPGVGLLGVVRAEATSTSTGRHGTARTSFKRTIC
ncbi:MAG TPA: hypothetical protein VGB03_08015, partial [Acidimicrobiales bacterium]